MFLAPGPVTIKTAKKPAPTVGVAGANRFEVAAERSDRTSMQNRLRNGAGLVASGQGNRRGLVGALQHAEEMFVVAGLERCQPDQAMCRFRKRVDLSPEVVVKTAAGRPSRASARVPAPGRASTGAEPSPCAARSRRGHTRSGSDG